MAGPADSRMSAGFLRLLSVSAIAGPALFAVLETVQSVFRSDRSFADPMSVYATGGYGFAQTIAFAALAFGSGALCLGLGYVLQPPTGWRAGRILLGLWSVGVLLAAVFPIDVGQSTSWTGTIHQVASFVSFTTILGAMFVLANAAYDVRGWSSFGRLSSFVAPVAAVSFLVAGATQHSIAFGVAQRLFLVAVVVWIGVAGTRLRSIGWASGVDNVRRALEVFNAGDLVGLATVLDPDVQWFPLAGTAIEACHNKKRVLATMRAHFEDGFRLADLEFIDAREQLVVGFRPPASAPGEAGSRFYNVFRLRHGTVIRIDDYAQRDEALLAAGIR